MTHKMKVKKIVIVYPCVVRDLRAKGRHGGDLCNKKVGDIMELVDVDANELIGQGKAEEYVGPLGPGENIWARKRRREEFVDKQEKGLDNPGARGSGERRSVTFSLKELERPQLFKKRDSN